MGMERKPRIARPASEADLLDIADNQKARIETPSIGSIHFHDLHDEDADRAGQRVDEATGELIVTRNTADVGHEVLRTIGPDDMDPTTGDIMGKINDGTDDDEAARWLRENGGLK